MLIAGLGCSACGSTHAVRHSRSTTNVAHVVPLALPPAANLIIIPPQRGAGDEQFGTFTASGTVYFEFSCKGKGPLTIVGVLQHISPCDGSPTGASVPYNKGERVHVVVQAKPGTTWRLAVGEHVAGATLVLVHSSGVGNKSFGTFELRGTITIATTCKGKGPIDTYFKSTSRKVIPGVGTYCPQTPGSSASFPVPAGVSGAAISVEAGPKVRWTITISETK